MPIEIKELHIKTYVSRETKEREEAPAQSGKREKSEKAIVAQCVEQVMEILNQKKER